MLHKACISTEAVLQICDNRGNHDKRNHDDDPSRAFLHHPLFKGALAAGVDEKPHLVTTFVTSEYTHKKIYPQNSHGLLGARMASIHAMAKECI